MVGLRNNVEKIQHFNKLASLIDNNTNNKYKLCREIVNLFNFNDRDLDKYIPDETTLNNRASLGIVFKEETLLLDFIEHYFEYDISESELVNLLKTLAFKIFRT